MTIVPPNAATEITKYYMFGGQRVAMRKNGVLTYLHSDHLGSTVLATNANGTYRSSDKYFAYGKDREPASSVPTDHKFTGQKLDASGLQYFNARFYDPVVGMFVSPDTIVPQPGLASDYNRYLAFRGNPLKFVDPSGHAANDKAIHDSNDGPPITNREADNLLTTYYDLGVDWNDLPNGAHAALQGTTYQGADAYPDVHGNAVSQEGTIRDPAVVGAAVGGGIYGGVKVAGILTEAACGDGDCTNELNTAISGCNSFSADTLVTTDHGLVPIEQIHEGDRVLAYNEETGETGYYTVTATLIHNDPQIVFLSIDGETIETTPEHPFAVAVSSQWLPLRTDIHWVNASELHINNLVIGASSGTGILGRIQILTQSQMMYNLTVAQAHTFFVGHGQWLVHNAGPCVSFQKLGGFSQDVLTKGYHLNSIVGEINLTPTRLANGTIQLAVGPAGTTTGNITNKIVQGAMDLLSKDPNGAIARANAIISNFGANPQYAQRVAQARLIIEALTSGNYTVTK